MINENESNLDKLCFEYGTQMYVMGNEKNENVIQKSLGVLQEDGVFAFYLYLKSRETKKDEKAVSSSIQEKIEALLKHESIGLLKGPLHVDQLKSLGESLDDLLLAKTLIEKTLIYALYQAKSM